MEMTETATRYTFLLEAHDMRELFSEWPERIALAVVRDDEQDSFYTLDNERLEAEIRSVGDGETLPVFPELSGFPRAKVSFAEESDLIQRIARRHDLLAAALERRAQLEAPVQEETDDIPEMTTTEVSEEEPPVTEEEPAVSGSGESLPPLVLANFPVLGDPTPVTVRARSDKNRLTLVVGSRLLAGLKGELRLLCDVSGQQIAFLPAEGAAGSGIALSGKATGIDAVAFTVPMSSLPEAAGKALATIRDFQRVPIAALDDSCLVLDLTAVLHNAEASRNRQSMTVMAGALCIFMAVAAGYAGLEQSGAQRQADPAPVSPAPSFESDSYMQDMMERLFPGADGPGN